jgi:hypothetical protein
MRKASRLLQESEAMTGLPFTKTNRYDNFTIGTHGVQRAGRDEL